MKSRQTGDLACQKCVACEGGTPALKGSALKPLLLRLGHTWKIVKRHYLEKEFKFKDFKDALNFTVRVGKIAESQGHHPDVYLTWGRVKITLSTHSVHGLTENDFILAAKVQKMATR